MKKKDILKKINLNCHSSLFIEGKYNIWIDPYHVQGETHNADVVLITHPHYDHFSPIDIEKVIKDGTVFVAPESMRVEMYRVSSNCIFVKPGDDIEVLGINIKALSAFNTEKNFHKKIYNWVGYLINIEDTKVYVSGDMDDCEEIEEGFCDIALIPIGGEYTMDVDEAVNFILKIKPPFVIPYHYGSVVGELKMGEEFKKKLAEKQKDKKIECILKMPS